MRVQRRTVWVLFGFFFPWDKLVLVNYIHPCPFLAQKFFCMCYKSNGISTSQKPTSFWRYLLPANVLQVIQLQLALMFSRLTQCEQSRNLPVAWFCF